MIRKLRPGLIDQSNYTGTSALIIAMDIDLPGLDSPATFNRRCKIIKEMIRKLRPGLIDQSNYTGTSALIIAMDIDLPGLDSPATFNRRCNGL